MCLAIPGQVVSIREPNEGASPLDRMGLVDFGGVRKEVSLGLLPEVVPGDYVIVHAGFALSKVDEEEARQVFEYLRAMETAEEAEKTA